MNKHVLKYLAKTLRSNTVTGTYMNRNAFRILQVADTLENSVCKNTISIGFSKSIHKSNKAEYFKNLDGTITVKPTNPNRKVDEENSVVKISNDADGWTYFMDEIKPYFPKGTRFKYLYRCPNDGKPYPNNVGNVTKSRGKIVSIYLS